jgi:ribose 5-phosphate isomerase B
MKIYFAADHAGFELKNELLNLVRGEFNAEVEDCGAAQYDEADDYPLIIAAAARKLSEDSAAGKDSRAIILGGSGTGEAIVANRFAHVRAALYYGGTLDIVKLSRQHNDANALSFGARFVSADEAKEAVRVWLSTPFSKEDRHVRRLKQIEKLHEE